ncbi:MAG: polysaccharide deacetylase family protein [Alistipes sp.]|nr:polysaccharide deacetylase family protein [Alistipes sp.]
MKILTFDIEEFTLYPQDNPAEIALLYPLLERILEFLDDRGVKATFFCLGEIARKYPDVIKSIDKRGHGIGCHSDKHDWLTRFTPQQFYDDTHAAIDSLEQVVGRKITGYRAPAFSITKNNIWALEVLYRCGITVDCSICPAGRDFGGFAAFPEDKPSVISYNGITMKELPMSVARICGKKMVFSGGGYFRLLPYGKIKSLSESKDYVMTYFHLHDFNTGQRKKITPRYFKSYYGIRKAFDKFTRYLDDFDFIDIQSADRQINWNEAPKISL